MKFVYCLGVLLCSSYVFAPCIKDTDVYGLGDDGKIVIKKSVPTVLTGLIGHLPGCPISPPPKRNSEMFPVSPGKDSDFDKDCPITPPVKQTLEEQSLLAEFDDNCCPVTPPPKRSRGPQCTCGYSTRLAVLAMVENRRNMGSYRVTKHFAPTPNDFMFDNLRF